MTESVTEVNSGLAHGQWTCNREVMPESADRALAPEYAALRRLVFDASPDDIGLAPTPANPRVYAAVMDVGYEVGVATLVSIVDGTTSLYTSGGGGILGTGAQEDVAAATRVFVKETDAALDSYLFTSDIGLPNEDQVILRALTFGGPRAVGASVAELQTGSHPLSRVYAAAQLVINAVRLVDEAPDVQ